MTADGTPHLDRDGLARQLMEALEKPVPADGSWPTSACRTACRGRREPCDICPGAPRPIQLVLYPGGGRPGVHATGELRADGSIVVHPTPGLVVTSITLADRP